MLLSYGVVTGIYFTLDTVVPKGEKVLTFTPVYDPFFAAIKNSGHTLVDCPLDHKDNYYTINWELLEKELADGVKAVVFCNPHNPIGRVWTEEEMGSTEISALPVPAPPRASFPRSTTSWWSTPPSARRSTWPVWVPPA